MKYGVFLVLWRIVLNLVTIAIAICFRSSQVFDVAMMWQNRWITRHAMKLITSLSMCLEYSSPYPLCWCPVGTQYSAILSVRGELLCGLNESVQDGSGSAQWSSVWWSAVKAFTFSVFRKFLSDSMDQILLPSNKAQETPTDDLPNIYSTTGPTALSSFDLHCCWSFSMWLILSCRNTPANLCVHRACPR